MVAKRKVVEAPQQGCGEGEILCQIKAMGWDTAGFYAFLAILGLLITLSVLRWMLGAKRREAKRRQTQGLLSDEELAAIEARAAPRR